MAGEEELASVGRRSTRFVANRLAGALVQSLHTSGRHNQKWRGLDFVHAPELKPKITFHQQKMDQYKESTVL